MDAKLDIRPSHIVGQWYPSDPHRLAESIDEYIASATPAPIEGEVMAVMVPHAGHIYSGPVAGYAFHLLRDRKPEVVAVVSPMHYPYPQPLLTTAHSAYATPLGTIPVDRPSVEALSGLLKTSLGFGITPVRNDPEHSLEIELPFLQRVLGGDFSLIPIMVRDQSALVTHKLGEALAEVLKNRNALLVASTDLSHFYPQNVAKTLDAEMLSRVEALDPEGVLRVEEEGKGFACGRAALAAVLWAAKALGADKAHILYHATSGDVTGDYSQVVGYAAAAVTRPTT